jgi:predicted house-cleaning NTP pyrophosphatase (Maf/HAM1 superfamily)
MVVGLTLALSVGAQTTEEEKKPEKKAKAKTEEKAQAVPQKSAQPNPPAKTHSHAQTAEHGATMQSHEAGQPNEKTHATQHTAAKNGQQSGGVTRSTTVFKNGHQTSENISVRRTTVKTTDVHFAIGTHPRDWWLRSYTIVSFSGCYYYQADNGYWYPAYGFDTGCSYPVGVVYISL